MERTVFAAEHADFAASVRAFVTRAIEPELARFRAEGAVDRAAWRSAGALGMLGLAIPARWGGSAADYRFRAAAVEELAALGHGISSTFSIHFDIAAPYVVDLASEPAAEHWLPRLATGEAIAALALTEPDAGSDLAALTTRAERDGEGWRLRGAKTFITNGGIADIAVVAARTGGDDAPASRSISLFLVPLATEGVAIDPLLTLGQHESNTAGIAFDDVRLDADSLLGEEGRGFAALMQHLPMERVSSAVANLAQARSAFAQGIDYGLERHAFGAPVATHQHNAFALADLSARLEAATAFVDACVVAAAEGRLSGADAARAKLLSAQVEHDVLDTVLQLHGGSGYLDGSAAGQAWIDGRVTRIWAGSAEVMRMIVARDLGLEP